MNRFQPDMQQVIQDISSNLFPDGPDIPKTLVAIKNGVIGQFDGIDSDVDNVFEFSQESGFVRLVEKERSTAEQWLTSQGYSPTSLFFLLDLEQRLAAAGSTSTKVSDVRTWVNSILAILSGDPSPRHAWPLAPHSFSEMAAEALAALEPPST